LERRFFSAASSLYFMAHIEIFTFSLMEGLERLNNGQPFELGGGGSTSWSRLLQNLISGTRRTMTRMFN